MASFKPAYIDTVSDGTIKEKIRDAFEILEDCVLCPRLCGVNRLSGETGVCKTGKNAAVSNFNPHFGEESPLVGTHGSGTIFFIRCNLLCIFCQNYDISHEAYGEEVSAEQIAGMMLMLQRSGCHNINFVTPSHVIPQILAAVEIAAEKGLCVPLIYNTGGYDRPEILKLLDGVFDIYMPDFKFWDPEIAKAACDAENYPEVARDAIIEMHRQVGDLVIDESGLACRGLLIRHLVLPQGLAGTRDIMRFIASEISPNTYINIMPQYRPCGRASEIKALAGFPSRTEYENALKIAKEEGIKRLDSEKRVFAIC